MKNGDVVERLGPLAAPEINYLSLYKVWDEHAGETIDIVVMRPGENELRRLHLRLPTRETK